jgi:hypothetical protein
VATIVPTATPGPKPLLLDGCEPMVSAIGQSPLAQIAWALRFLTVAGLAGGRWCDSQHNNRRLAQAQIYEPRPSGGVCF